MKVYIDCDVAVKFAQWGMLSRLTNHLVKQGRAELYTVSTLKYRFKLAKPDKAAAMLGSIAAVHELTSFVTACKPAQGHSTAVAEALAAVPSIDVGEAALFAAAGHYDAALVDTGDKRALRAVGTLPSNSKAHAALSGKLACLEQTVHYLIGRWTFPVVNTAVGSFANADTSTTSCFKPGTEKEVLAALQGRIDELATDCGLLAPKPFSWVP